MITFYFNMVFISMAWYDVEFIFNLSLAHDLHKQLDRYFYILKYQYNVNLNLYILSNLSTT